MVDEPIEKLYVKGGLLDEPGLAVKQCRRRLVPQVKRHLELVDGFVQPLFFFEVYGSLVVGLFFVACFLVSRAAVFVQQIVHVHGVMLRVQELVVIVNIERCTPERVLGVGVPFLGFEERLAVQVVEKQDGAFVREIDDDERGKHAQWDGAEDFDGNEIPQTPPGLFFSSARFI